MARVKHSRSPFFKHSFFFLNFFVLFLRIAFSFFSSPDPDPYPIMSESCTFTPPIDKKKVLDDVWIMDPTYQLTALLYDGSDDEDDDNNGVGRDKNKNKGGSSGDGVGNGDGGDKAEGGDGEEKGMNKDCTGQLGFSYRCTYHAGYENGYPVEQLHALIMLFVVIEETYPMYMINYRSITILIGCAIVTYLGLHIFPWIPISSLPLIRVLHGRVQCTNVEDHYEDQVSVVVSVLLLEHLQQSTLKTPLNKGEC